MAELLEKDELGLDRPCNIMFHPVLDIGIVVKDGLPFVGAVEIGTRAASTLSHAVRRRGFPLPPCDLKGSSCSAGV